MDGTWVDTAQLPWGYQIGTDRLDYDPVTGHIIMPYIESYAGPEGFLHVSPMSNMVLFTEGFDFSSATGLGMIMGFHLTEDAYWLLGPDYDAGGINKLVHVDRSSLQVVRSFNVSGGTGQNFPSLTGDPATGLFYMHDWSTGTVKVFQIPEPCSLLLLGLGGLALLKRRG